MVQDLRSTTRKALHSRGTVVIEGQVIPFETIDIGPGGMSILLVKQLQAGLHCRVDVPLFVSGRRFDIAAFGKITYCVCGRDGFKAGITFAEMINKGSQAAIARYM